MINIIRIILCIIVNLISVIASFTPLNRLDIVYKYLATLVINTLGYKKPKVIDLRKYKYDSNIIVYQHNSFCDGHIIYSVFGKVNLVFTSKYGDMPVLKQFAKGLEFILVNPKEKGNSEKINNFIENNPKNIVAIAPAPINNTGYDKIGKFATGSFVTMKPVIPVLIRYKNIKPTWFLNEEDNNNHKSIGQWFLERFSDKPVDVEVTIMEEISSEGCKNVEEYKNKVENAMKEYNIKYPVFSRSK